MGIRQDVFGLEQIYQLQLQSNWPTINDVWVTPITADYTTQPYGYAAAGEDRSNPYPYLNSSLDRIDFNNDTVTTSRRGDLSNSFGVSWRTHAFSSISKGYVGAESPRHYEVVDFASDTGTHSTLSGTYSSGRNFAASSNQNFGYIAGGEPGGTVVYRFDYSSDTSANSPKGPLSVARYWFCGNGNQNYGYMNSGITDWNTAYTSVVDRIDYGNDTATASPKGPLNVTGVYEAGMQTATGNADYSYVAGGFNKTRVNRIDYSNDTATALVKGSMSYPSKQMASTGDLSYGWFFGGGSNPHKTQVTRIDYSNDTPTSSPRGPLSAGRYWQADGGGMGSSESGMSGSLARTFPMVARGVSQGTDQGYFGGNGGPKQSIIDRINFANDNVTASPRGALSSGNENLAATGNAFFGYFGGGDADGTPGYSSKIDRVDYSNDTPNASTKGPLNHGRKSHSATGNQNFGYFITGFAPSNSSYIDRADYSNDTATALTKGNNEFAQFGTASTGNKDFGYVGGGSEGAYTHVSRIDYANDGIASIDRGNLSSGAYFGAATGNASFGYFGGGKHAPDPVTAESRISRIDYSNDTAVSVVKGPLNTAKQSLAATGNSDFGYFAGGYDPSPVVSKVERVDYSNDTTTASPKGPLSRTSYLMGATSSRANANTIFSLVPLNRTNFYGDSSTPVGTDFGYFSGGDGSPGNISAILRLDFNNDTTNPLHKSNISTGSRYTQSVSNTSHLYVCGGNNVTRSTVDRLDFSNDTANASVRGPLTRNRTTGTAFGNQIFGYVVATGWPGNVTTIERIEYSNDTATATIKGNAIAGSRFAGAGNQNFGYIIGGELPSDSSTVQRVQYSNDTTTASPKGTLTYVLSQGRASGNANFAFVAGGGGIPAQLSTSNRIDYSNDTATAVTKGPLSTGRYSSAATGNTSVGYFGGGQYVSSIDCVDYSNDTATAVHKANFATVQPGVSGGYNATNFSASSSRENGHPTSIGLLNKTMVTFDTGYFAGGYNPNVLSTVDRLDYSSDTGTMVTKGPLSVARYGAGSASNASFGYIAGGATPDTSIVDRVDYSNDTATASQRGPLTSAKSYVNGVGNVNFGYISGGDLTTVDRIDYSNDSATASPKGPLNNNRRYISAVGNQDFGYFAGGGNPRISSVDRIDYSNDTATASPKGPLSEVKSSAGATGNASFGYFGAGSNGSNVSTVERLDYSNDTSTSIRGPLTTARFIGEGATGTASSGYFAGGGPGYLSTVERIDYDNDTATAVVKGSLSDGRNVSGAVSAKECGFVPIGPAVVANSPVQVQPPAPEGGSSVFSTLVSLVTTLSNATAATGTNLQNIQSLIESAHSSFNVFAVVGSGNYAESLSGTGVAGGKRTHTAKGFNYNSSSSNIISTGSEIVDMSGGSSSSISGGSVIDGKKWMAMAQFDGTNFDGILLWIFTGDSINSSGTITSGGRTVTNTRDIFYPAGTGSTDYHHIYPIAIAADGTIYSNVNSGKSGWNFSNNTSAQSATGYNSNGNMSGDDGVWAFVISAGSNSFFADGNSPGTDPKTTSYPSFGMGNYNAGDSSGDTYWNGTNTSSTNNVGFVFTGDA
tara:strand:- start:628 stop:5373 length:4746 start_codon:yes stop_codon:yes gene_type:complete